MRRLEYEGRVIQIFQGQSRRNLVRNKSDGRFHLNSERKGL